ncbi:MAG: SDR family oxidoreductase [Hoeflea sp.]|uniref:SDR family oxidoreductase n=1 Tax=Hoeflea sp. TaxID=1940281 RepID=UPI001D6BDE14|nr:SDR family oxidoreductase [Hoeflea sp.]MBU4529952.1 SDR family oxidoreductase [Alphaproteobacteria bacterium]MBU4543179.1 SDR family oxidoreductase [Alphaproteobacteria bacterium]MBU4550281.1 SDR family oxidoreductase [Alphaproteobacteria bacterium]MBV1722445.1 SDR family oxidoreductase [Hoeflea sp.]MBV1761595.1 SDR family oxidoreductase [Hoeflea sp.]
MTTILITGTNRGIGLELAKQALAKGWTVYGSARAVVTDPDAHICHHPKFHDLVFDVTDHEAVRAAAASISEPIDILINNAGTIGPKRQSTLDMDFEGFAQTLAINTLAPLAVAQAFLPHLKRSANPRILTISSQMGRMSYAKSDQIAYRASKAAVNKVMQGLATDLAPMGVAVVLVHPGWVRTDMGGPGADIDAATSAGGILTLAEGLSLDGTGQFTNWDGSAAEW